MSENMARLSKEHHATVERAETPIKSSSKNRFTNIFKSSPCKSPWGSIDSIDKDEKLRPGFVKVGLHPADRARLSDESPHFSLTMVEIKPQELTAPTAVGEVIHATGKRDAEKMVSEWQAELEDKKEGNEEEEEEEEEEGQQTALTKPSYGRRNTIGEILEVDPNWFSYFREEEEEVTVVEWSKRVDDISPVSKRYSYYDRKAGRDDLQSSQVAEKGTPVRKEDTVDSWDKHISELTDTSSPRTSTANRRSTGYEKHEVVEEPYTFQAFSPIMEECVTGMGSIIQDNRNMETSEQDSLAVEDGNTQIDDDLEDGASVNSANSSSKLLVNTKLLQQLYEQGVPTPEGVQFYVNRKIAEVLLAHEEKFHRPISARRLEAPKWLKVGPIFLTHPVLVSKFRQAVRLIYYAILFFTALAGPKTFFVWIWKMAAIFGIYEVITRELGWKDKQTPDLLLEPLHHGTEQLLGKGEDAAMRLGYTLGPFISDIVRGVVDGNDDEEVE